MLIESLLRDNLLHLAQAYAEAKGVSLATVSRSARGDGEFFDMLLKQQQLGDVRGDDDRAGSFTARVYDKIVSWFDANWPTDVERPALTFEVYRVISAKESRR